MSRSNPHPEHSAGSHQHHHGPEAPAAGGAPADATAAPIRHDRHAHHTEHGTRGSHHRALEHDRHAGHSVAMFRDRFWLSLILTLPTLVWGHMLPRVSAWVAPTVPGSTWIAPIFGTAVFLYGGLVFLKSALGELRARLPGMMTLISLAISVAFAFSVAVTLGYPGMALWEELATLVTVMLLGHWIEMRSISQAHGALKELARLLPRTVLRLEGDRADEVSISGLRENDRVLVRPGAAIPVDGVVESGSSDVNESMLTGESALVQKREGAHVIAGTLNGSGSLRVRVTGTGERTALAGIMRLVDQAQSSKSRAQALADRAAFVLTLLAIGAATLTGLVWLMLGAEGAFAVERVVTVLVIACPHALGLAVPLVIAISTTMGAKAGLLVRDRRGLEEARNLDLVVFDKTGTLTLGEHRVVDGRTLDGLSGDDALRLAAALERDSEHPVGRAIVTSAEERKLSIPSSSGFEAIPGHGVRGRVEGRDLEIGGPNLLRSRSVDPPPDLVSAAESYAGRGQSAIYLLEGDRALAVFAVADAIRPESREAIDTLHRMGVEVAMITGDSKAVAESVGKTLGIDTVLAEVLPEQKAARIQELQRRGKRVAMVGDGVNDAPALVTSDVGIAIGAGTDVAVEAGDVVLVRSDPRDVPRIVKLSKASYRKMTENLWWSAGYNIFAIPLAAGVLASRGLLLPPALGAVLMSASTVIVAINAQLLRRQKL